MRLAYGNCPDSKDTTRGRAGHTCDNHRVPSIWNFADASRAAATRATPDSSKRWPMTCTAIAKHTASDKERGAHNFRQPWTPSCLHLFDFVIRHAAASGQTLLAMSPSVTTKTALLYLKSHGYQKLLSAVTAGNVLVAGTQNSAPYWYRHCGQASKAGRHLQSCNPLPLTGHTVSTFAQQPLPET